MATSGMDGQLRVTHVEKKKAQDMYLSTNVRYSADIGHLKARLGHLAWNDDNRTLLGIVAHSSEIAFFRMRKKKDAAPGTKFPFELVELSKRRFATAAKVLGSIHSCVIDHTHTKYPLLLTESDDPAHGNVTVAWDCTNGEAVGKGNLGATRIADDTTSPTLRLSPDGRFLCRGTLSGSAVQVKLFEVLKKKVKGEVEPVFDGISTKSVMTLVVGEKVADVCFSNNSNNSSANMAIVCCVSGMIQLWSLDVECRLREDPKMLCSFQLPDKTEVLYSVASPTTNRIAIVTANSALHILKYSESSIEPVFTIEETHEQLVANVQFCPSGADTIYTRGDQSKDVFAWNVGKL